AVVGARAGGGRAARVDRHGERGLEGALLAGDHQRDAKLLKSLPPAGHADDAPAVGGHEVDGLGRHLLPGHDEVALVLPVGVVHDDDDPAGADVLDRVLDRREAIRRAHREPSFRSSLSRPMNRSTYFATRSTSTFTL